MHLSKPPKIQNQTKNTKREPELEAPRTDLQIGHHVIEAEPKTHATQCVPPQAQLNNSSNSASVQLVRSHSFTS